MRGINGTHFSSILVASLIVGLAALVTLLLMRNSADDPKKNPVGKPRLPEGKGSERTQKRQEDRKKEEDLCVAFAEMTSSCRLIHANIIGRESSPSCASWALSPSLG